MSAFAGMVLAMCLASPSLLATPRFTGMVQDRNGPVDGANVALWLYETGKGLQVETVAGRFSISPAKEGNYLFRVEKNGRTPAYGAVHLFGDGEHPIQIYLRPKDPGNEVGEDTPPPPIAPPDVPPRKPVEGTVMVAKRLKYESPVYPDADKQNRIQGDVVMTVIILKDGTVDDLVVLASPNVSLAVSSLAAVRKWKYRPTELAGEPVDVITDVTIHFRLE